MAPRTPLPHRQNTAKIGHREIGNQQIQGDEPFGTAHHHHHGQTAEQEHDTDSHRHSQLVADRKFSRAKCTDQRSQGVTKKGKNEVLRRQRFHHRAHAFRGGHVGIRRQGKDRVTDLDIGHVDDTPQNEADKDRQRIPQIGFHELGSC